MSRTNKTAASRPTTVPPASTVNAPGASPLVSLLIGLPVVLLLVGVVAALLVTPALAVVAVVGALLAGLEWTFGRSSRLVAALGGRSVGAKDEPRLFNLLEGLCIANGLGVPEVRVLSDPSANALLIDGAGGSTFLFCTTELLDLLDRVELEGVIAHELAGEKRGETSRAARLLVATGWLCGLTGLGGRLTLALSEPGRRVLADDVAVGMTRYPPGLRSALAKMAAGPTTPQGLTPFVLRVTGPNWCVPIVATDAPVRAGELDLDLRVTALAER